MTNLQNNAQIISPTLLRRLWFGLPLGTLLLAALLLATSLLLPKWRSMQEDDQRLRDLEGLQTQVSLMRQQLRAQDIQEETALSRKDRLFRLIAGSGDVSTMLAVLDREAKVAGVQLDLFEPQAATPAAAPPPPGRPPGGPGAQQAAPANPLEQAGLQPSGMVISVQGSYLKLLDFLRRLESLNVLVIQNNLRLELPSTPPSRGKGAAAPVTMKISLTLYSQTAASLAAASAAARPPAAAGAAPASPGSPPVQGGSPPAPAGQPAAPGAAPASPAAPPPANGAAPPAASAPPAAGAPAAPAQP